jgi:hypothetical protein
MEVVKRALERFRGLVAERREARAPAVIACREVRDFFTRLEQAKAGGTLLLVPRGLLPTPTLVHAAREVPVVAAESFGEALPLLEALRLPLEPGLYEARARLIKQRDRERALSELERVASGMVGWPAVVAVYPPSWPELRVAGVVEVRAEGVCGVLALRRVV